MKHPSSLDLEAFACGERSTRAHVEAHVAECDACRTFLEKLGAFIADTSSDAASETHVARAVAQVREARDASAMHKPRQWWLLSTSIAAPLAAAAALLLLARTPHDAVVVSVPDPSPTIPSPTPTADPDTTFKGGLQLAVIRERSGEQARFAAPMRVRPGDRLRVEVALDREQTILGGVLSDDGTYLELMPLAVRGPGTHFSEKSARIDGSPIHGTLLVGTPQAVNLARATHRFDDVASLRVEWESSP